MSAEQIEGEKVYVARLVHGDIYWLKDKQFVAGEDNVVSEREMLHLYEHAVIVVPTPGFDEQYDAPEDRTTTRDMFAFRELTEGEEIEDVVQPDPSRRTADREARRARVIAEVRAGTRSKVQRRERRVEGAR